MNKLRLALFAAAFLCFVTPLSHAAAPKPKPHINGCVNSPENPTAILAAIGSAGAVFASRRSR